MVTKSVMMEKLVSCIYVFKFVKIIVIKPSGCKGNFNKLSIYLPGLSGFFGSPSFHTVFTPKSSRGPIFLAVYLQSCPPRQLYMYLAGCILCK